LCLWFVEPEDEAVKTLSEHFLGVIQDIVDGKWKHYRVSWRTGETKVFVVAKSDLDNSLVINRHPQPFWLESFPSPGEIDRDS
jgi:hypothetical protein